MADEKDEITNRTFVQRRNNLRRQEDRDQYAENSGAQAAQMALSTIEEQLRRKNEADDTIIRAHGEAIAVLIAEVKNIKSGQGHTCPLHQEMGERLTACEQKQEATEKFVKETVCPQINTLYTRQWGVLLGLFMLILSYVSGTFQSIMNKLVSLGQKL